MVIKAENKTKSSKQERKKQYNLNPDIFSGEIKYTTQYF